MRSDREPEQLLSAAGFTDVLVTDLTGAFLETARAWYAGSAEREQELRSIVGGAAFDQQQADREGMIAAIEEGLLSRALYVAAKPVRA